MFPNLNLVMPPQLYRFNKCFDWDWACFNNLHCSKTRRRLITEWKVSDDMWGLPHLSAPSSRSSSNMIHRETSCHSLPLNSSISTNRSWGFASASSDATPSACDIKCARWMSLSTAGVIDAAREILCMESPVSGSIRWLAICAMSRFARSSSMSWSCLVGRSEPRARRLWSSSAVNWLRRRWEWWLKLRF